jgi:molybdopterin-containing oxidoreductase family iron-sulfur binding subunit
MSTNRRQFLKIAGISTIAGLGSSTLFFNKLSPINLEASQVSLNPGVLTAKRWGMAVDMSKFKTEEDYNRVAHACHSIHNVPDFRNPKDEVKWIWHEKFEHAFPEQKDEYMAERVKHKPFIVLCNHCEHPPCVRVCPTKATFKRFDGIVMMDMHRCIGCRFCMAACPYGARSFNWWDPRGKDKDGRPYISKVNPEYPTRTKGVVEKCTFCTERLAKGLKPACVEKSNGGLVFGDLEDPDSEIRETLRKHYTTRRKPEMGTRPSIYYVIGGVDNA